MSFEFLAVEATGAVARSPMEGQAQAAGARFELRDGWNVAVAYGDSDAADARSAGGWVDVSHLGKLELQGADLAALCGVALELGRATRAERAWWCPLTPERALVLGATARLRRRLEASAERVAGASVVEATSSYAALTLCGPPAREIFARFTAIDVRPESLAVGGLRPGSVARTPGLILREAPERFLMLFGWAFGEYMWTVVEDAGRHLGARPLGVDALEPLAEPAREEAARA